MGRYVNFNSGAYTSDLTTAMNGALEEVSNSVYRHAVNNIMQLKARKMDVPYISSFPRAIKRTTTLTANRVTTSISMDNSTGNQSFRALYYEYGTGRNMRPPVGWSPSDDPSWNSARPMKPSADIYYRDRPWYDLGGNYHKRHGVKRGVRKRIPRRDIYGHGIQPQYWFQRAVKEGSKDIDQAVLKAVKSVPITAYIGIRDVRARM